MLKAIEIEFNKKRYLINQWISLINRYTSEMIDQIIVKGINSVGQWYSKGQFYEDMMFLTLHEINCHLSLLQPHEGSSLCAEGAG